MIKQSEIYLNYLDSKEALNNSDKMKEKVKLFIETKELYEQVEKYGKYHPDYKELSLKVRQVKRDMEKEELFLNFKNAENDLQFLLNDISVKIGHTVSTHIKVPLGDLYFSTSSSCSSSCGTGGSCGCSK